MFHLTHHTRPTTVQMERVGETRQYVVFNDLAPTQELPTVPAEQPVDAWTEVRMLTIANDQASRVGDARLEMWYNRMLVRLAEIRQPLKHMAEYHARWEAYWATVSVRLTERAAQRASWLRQVRAAGRAADLQAAYDSGGTAQMPGLVAQVRQMIVESALAGAGVAA